MASEEVWRHYHRRRHEIEWAFLATPENLDAIAMMRALDRATLRDEVREMVRRGFCGPYLIPV